LEAMSMSHTLLSHFSRIATVFASMGLVLPGHCRWCCVHAEEKMDTWVAGNVGLGAGIVAGWHVGGFVAECQSSWVPECLSASNATCQSAWRFFGPTTWARSSRE
jgi:hypothetical protein